MKRTLTSDNFIVTRISRKHQRLQVPEAPYYDFDPLIEKEQNLRKHAKRNPVGGWVIDFGSRAATLALTNAILKHHFQLSLTLPSGHLVPTIPSRVQYLLWAAALLRADAPKKPLVVLDIGTGPSCIYPMLGSRIFPRWSFIASDSDPQAVDAARRNCEDNSLSSIRVVQSDSKSFFPEAILKEKPILTVSNPPFHEIFPNTDVPAGTETQLTTDGGELAFLSKMARESRAANEVRWFTSLIGRKVDLPKIVAFLRSKEIRAPLISTAELSQGGRTTRWAVAWSFGEEVSTVQIVKDSSSAWRCALRVIPGRKFANHLGCQDIIDITCSACRMLGWEKVSAMHTTTNQETAVLRLSGRDGQKDVELLVDCLPKSPTGEFELILKINRKGSVTPDFVRGLGKSVCAKMLVILNESVS